MNGAAWLRGSFPPLVTPFRAGAVDYEAYVQLVEAQAQGGSAGIVVNGTTGEPSTLTVQERNRLVDVALEAAAGRLRVVAATGSQSLAETQALTAHAVEAGADALLIVTPYYIRPPQRGLVAYYAAVTRGLPPSLPWMIYHIPGRAAVQVDLETLRAIADRCEGFAGMKHASTDLGFVADALKALPELRIFVGLEELSFPMMAIGAVGLMNAAGNLHPRILVELCEAVESGDLVTARSLHERMLELNRAIFFDTNPIPIKYMMKRLGLLEANEHRLPMVPATEELERRLDGVLERCGLFDLAMR
ncbi:MAG: 4-hydroxy-tetrahydrodipicolinate synthase [Candidatus Eremiobacteraeota bacterium]|nr:4-hydroxy-tetrahydrodipicolinate synthase [Candidatus Eremiobacteraeota bacterium]